MAANKIRKPPAAKKAGNILTIGYSGIFCIVLFCILTQLIIYRYDSAVSTFSPNDPNVHASKVECSRDYDKESFGGCLPTKCGRVYIDKLINDSDTEILLNIAKKGLALGGGNGGASILDLHGGALSKGDKFIDFYKLPEAKNIFTQKEIQIYRTVKEKIKERIESHFGLTSSLHLTKPTFFSRMDSKPAITQHDEYWHPHIDKLQYKTFHYTSLIYLTTYGEDFNGGRFVFVDGKKQTFIEPKFGRVSFFTSGQENIHNVERVTSGTRYALTIPFTCNPEHAIEDPVL